MSTNAVVVPVTAGAVGAAVSASALAAKKTIAVKDVQGSVTIEAGIGGKFCAIRTFTQSRTDVVVEVVCDELRVDATSGDAGSVVVAAERALSRFVSLPAPAAPDSAGEAVDVTFLGDINSIFYDAPDKGVGLVEISEDGSDWVQVFGSFTSAGCQTDCFSAKYARVRGQGGATPGPVSMGAQENALAALTEPLTTIVWRPGATGEFAPGGNVYTEWEDAVAAARSIADFGSRRVEIEVDSSFQFPSIIPSSQGQPGSGFLFAGGGNFSDGETVTIGGKVYTFQAALTDVDGNVLLGGSTSASLNNLVAAINLDPAGAGTAYAASMTAGVAYDAFRSFSVMGIKAPDTTALATTGANASWTAAAIAGEWDLEGIRLTTPFASQARVGFDEVNVPLIRNLNEIGGFIFRMQFGGTTGVSPIILDTLWIQADRFEAYLTDAAADPMMKIENIDGFGGAVVGTDHDNFGTIGRLGGGTAIAPVIDINNGALSLGLGGFSIEDNSLTDNWPYGTTPPIAFNEGFIFWNNRTNGSNNGRVQSFTYDLPGLLPGTANQTFNDILINQRTKKQVIEASSGPVTAEYGTFHAIDTTAGNVVLDMPGANPAYGEEVIVKNVAAANNVVVTPLAANPWSGGTGDNIDTLAPGATLNVGPGECKTFRANGQGTWYSC